MKHSSRQSGFTLLELLVAVTITLMLAGVMVVVTGGTLNLWRRSQDGFTTATEAKLVLDYLERDLQSALYRADGKTWLAVDVINDSGSLTNHGWLNTGTIKPATESGKYRPADVGGVAATIAEARFGLSGAWLRFIGTNVDSSGSVPVAISYQIARRPISGAVSSSSKADVRYGLFRSAVSTSNTFGAGYDVTNGAYTSSSQSPQASRAAATLTNPNGSDLIATNVVDFGVWLYSRDSAGALSMIYPTGNTGTSSHRANTASSFPVVADVMVRVLTEEGAKLIDGIENGGGGGLTRPSTLANDGEWWWAIAEAHSWVVVRRIEIKGTSL